MLSDWLVQGLPNWASNLEYWLLRFEVVSSVVYVLGVICAAHAVMSVRSSRGAIAWSISLITFPWAALPLYLILGRRRFYGYRQTVRSAYFLHRQTVRRVHRQLCHYAVDLPPSLQGFEQVLHEFLPVAFLRGNQIRLLINGDVAYDVMLKAMQQAEQYILLQVYIVHDDMIGNALRRVLIAKAAQGVQVFLLYDGIGSQGLSWRYRRSLRSAGVQVQEFKSSRGWRNPLQLNFRNHRKILIVDGIVGFTGGLNIGDEYIGRHPRLSPWRDTAIRLKGPVVQPLQTVFLSDWQWVTGKLPQVSWDLLSPSSSAALATSTAIASSENMVACVFPTGANDDRSICKLGFVSAIDQAQQRLWIASPYFVPDDAVMTALQLAALRGVDVRILLPNRPDHLLVYLCSFSYYDEMLNAGVQIYRYVPGFMHQKAILIDDVLTGIGTVNLDNRSFSLNFEVTVWVHDIGFITAVSQMLNDDFQVSRRVSRQEYAERSLVFRLAARIARLFATIL